MDKFDCIKGMSKKELENEVYRLRRRVRALEFGRGMLNDFIENRDTIIRKYQAAK